jgi:hypothetical protein
MYMLFTPGLKNRYLYIILANYIINYNRMARENVRTSFKTEYSFQKISLKPGFEKLGGLFY